MSAYTYSYLKTAESIISQYAGEVPFALHIKSYFKLNKKFGGRDRKQINHFCYCYFRTGNLFKSDTIETRLKKSLYLCSNDATVFLQQIDESFYSNATLSYTEKLAFLGVTNPQSIFPFYTQLSELSQPNDFLVGQLSQPYLYIRIRPQHLASVLSRLNKLDIGHKIFDPYTVQLPNGFKVEEHFELNKEVVIQDYSSQQVVNELLPLMQQKHAIKVWDACAASGGKSILLNDLFSGKIDFYVTDVRETILFNLQKRFAAAKILNYKSAEHNLARKPLQQKEQFDIVICDVPCSGSGTWARTPEQKIYFKQKQLDEFIQTQKNITTNAIQSVKPGGYFLYITCSVYRAENESRVEDLLATTKGITLLHATLIEGSKFGADTMFTAIFQKALI